MSEGPHISFSIAETEVSFHSGMFHVIAYSGALNPQTKGYGTAGSPYEGYGEAVHYSAALDMAVKDLVTRIAKVEEDQERRYT